MSKKSSNPRDRIGVFKRFADVPPRYRLGQYEAEYADRDVWEEFIKSREFDHDSDHIKQGGSPRLQPWEEPDNP